MRSLTKSELYDRAHVLALELNAAQAQVAALLNRTSSLYPLRPYASIDEIEVGDTIRMRHDGELHHGVSPAFDDNVISAIDGDVVTLVRPHMRVWSDEIETLLETYTVSKALLVERFDVLTTGVAGRKDNRRSRYLHESGYWTVLIPYVEGVPTEWHPTEAKGPLATLSRGAFKYDTEATQWADDKLLGHPYTLQWIAGSDPERLTP